MAIAYDLPKKQLACGDNCMDCKLVYDYVLQAYVFECECKLCSHEFANRATPKPFRE